MKVYFKRKVLFGGTKCISVFALIRLMSFNATVKKSVFYKFGFCFLLHIAQNKRELMGFSAHLVPWVLLGRNIISDILQMLVWRVFLALNIGEQMLLFQTHIEEEHFYQSFPL